MTLIKQGIDISFAQGLDTKTDPKRVQVGNFVSLENTIFEKGGLLQKRNGYAQLASLPNTSSSYVTTLNGALTAVGTNIAAYNSSNSAWVSKGNIQPMSINTLPLIRNTLNQTAVDSVVAPNGLVCTVYTETNGSVTTNKYVIASSITGQNVVAPTVIPVASGTVSGGMRVFVLGNNFILMFTNTISSTAHLQYIAISTATPTLVGANTDIASGYIPASTLSWDAFVVDTNLYIAYNTTAVTQSIKVVYLTKGLTLGTAKTFAGRTATMMSVSADVTTPSSPVIYVSFYDSASSTGYTLAVDANLNTLMTPTEIISTGSFLNIASTAKNGVVQIFAEAANNYSFDSSIPTHFIDSVTVALPATVTTGTVGSPFVSIRSVGLASKAYLVPSLAGTTTYQLYTSLPSATAVKTGTSVYVAQNNTTYTSNGTTWINANTTYFLGTYQSSYQPTYFLVNGSISTSASPVVSAKLAYENGGGYLTTGLPGMTVVGNTIQFPYLFKDLIQAVNKNTNVPAGSQVNGIYSQTGITLGTLQIGTQDLDTAEIGGDLHLSGGFLWMYDGYLPVEHNFFLWPDTDQANPTDTASYTASAVAPTGTASNGSNSIVVSSATGVALGMVISDTTNAGYIPAGTTITAISGTTLTMSANTTHAISGDTLAISGVMAAKPDSSTNTNAYFYQFTYEWTDNVGNAYRSAPSIPVSVTTSGSASTGSVVLNIPTLRLTYKTANPVKIVIYRWSVAQQNYYQVTSITAPLLNSTTVDSVTFTDVLSDAEILGNNLIYTTGGVVEDVNAPASNLMTLFDTRLWLVDAEDQNLLWFSKQVIEATPVEMSDLFTMYIAPTTGAQGSTGPITALSVMDDKLIIFKQNAIYYVNGTGPDNTGANNQYSQPIFVTSTVGCSNQQSIVFMPQGLMFQSDKGIWLLDRSLNTSYIGAPVEKFNTGTVESAQNIPETNQVRFILSTGITLMYDYFYSQWGTFSGVPALSSCIFQGLHTFINQYGQAYQESPGLYVDGSNPVLMSFTTGPLRLDNLQSYQRAYEFFILGDYISPHKLMVSMSYNYTGIPSHSVLLEPSNYSTPYGSGVSQSPYGQGNPYGGQGSIEHYRVFLQQQRCQAFAITVQEIFDASFGTAAGAGLTISGLNVICGFKSKWSTISSTKSYG